MNIFRITVIFTIFFFLIGCKDDSEKNIVMIDYESIFPSEPKWYVDKYERNEVEEIFGVSSDLIYNLLSGLENSIHARLIAGITEDTTINYSLINNLRSKAQDELNILLSDGMSLKDIDVLRFKNYSEAQSFEINPYSIVSLKKFEILADYFNNYGVNVIEGRYNAEYYNQNIQIFYEKLAEQGVMANIPEDEWELYSIDNLRYLGGISFKDIKEKRFKLSDIGENFNNEVIISNQELVAKMEAMKDLQSKILMPLSPSIYQDELYSLLEGLSTRNKPALQMEIRLNKLRYESALREFESLLSNFQNEYLANSNQEFTQIIERASAINERAKATVEQVKLL